MADNILLNSMIDVVEMLADSSFHVMAIQFGIDQLQGAPSQFLSAFIFWYFMVEFIPDVMYIYMGLHAISFIPTIINGKLSSFQLFFL